MEILLPATRDFKCHKYLLLSYFWLARQKIEVRALNQELFIFKLIVQKGPLSTKVPPHPHYQSLELLEPAFTQSRKADTKHSTEIQGPLPHYPPRTLPNRWFDSDSHSVRTSVGELLGVR